MFGAELDRLKAKGSEPGADLRDAIEKTRADYERSLDAKWSAARGYTDAIIDPTETRQILELCLDTAAHARPLIRG